MIDVRNEGEGKLARGEKPRQMLLINLNLGGVNLNWPGCSGRGWCACHLAGVVASCWFHTDSELLHHSVQR